MPPIITTLIAVVPLLVSAAKDAKPIIDAAKQVITDFLNKGLISVDQQNALHAHMDALESAALAGVELPEFVVEPDPAE